MSSIFIYFFFAKVREWSDGKERNIRALISSLQAILWEEAKLKWKPIGLHDLMQGNKVCLIIIWLLYETLLKGVE